MPVVVDRQAEFKKLNAGYIESGEAEPANTRRASSVLPEDDLFRMNDFYRQIDATKAKLGEIAGLTKESQAEHESSLEAVKQKHREKHDRRCEQIVLTVRRRGAEVKRALKDMEQLNNLIQQDPTTAALGHTRMRVLMHHYLSSKFKAAMDAFNEVQDGMKEKRLAQIDRQYLVMKPEAPPAELEQLHETELSTEQLFQMGMDKRDLREQFDALIGRRDSMFKIERQVSELQKLYADFGQMVLEQGEDLDNVGYYCNTTIAYLELSNEHMVEGVQYMKNIRRLRCAII